MIFKRKEKKELLSADSAVQMLQNIFEACEVEPNTVSLEDLESYSNYRRDKFRLQKIAIVIIIAIFLLIPILFVSPVLSMTESSSYENGISYKLSVNSLIPIKNITAKLDGHNVPVYQLEEGCYSIEPDSNGSLVVRVNLLNRQFDTVTADVTGFNADYDTPKLIEYDKVGDKIQIAFEDEKSGINYDGIYAETLSNERLKPEIIKQGDKKGVVAFNYNNQSLNAYIPDNDGNTLQLIITVDTK